MADRRTRIDPRPGDDALTSAPPGEVATARRPGWAALAGTAIALTSLAGMWRAGGRAHADLEDQANAGAATAAAGYLALTVPSSPSEPLPIARLLSAASIVQRGPAWGHAGLQVGIGRVALLADPPALSRLDSASRSALARDIRPTIIVRGGRRMAAVPIESIGGDGAGWVVAWNALHADRAGRDQLVLAIAAALATVFAALAAPSTRAARERVMLWAVPVTAAGAVAVGILHVDAAARRAAGDVALARTAGLARMADLAVDGVQDRLETLAPGLVVVQSLPDDARTLAAPGSAARVARVVTLRSGHRVRLSMPLPANDLLGRQLGAWAALVAVGVAVAVRWDRPRVGHA